VGAFLTSLAVAVVIPVATAVASTVWRLLGKNEWTPDDFVLAFEFLVAAVVVQLDWIGGDLVTGAWSGDRPARLWEAIAARLGVLVGLGLLLLPMFAVGLRYYTRSNALTEAVAIRISLVAAGVLMLTFLVNYFLWSSLGVA
jgi:hypothetical protein